MKAALFMGSDSDWPIMKPAAELLQEFGVTVDVIVASAHRTPAKVQTYAESARENGVSVIIAAAGAAAHLAGVIASYTTLPIIGVPINATPLNGLDALFSTVQMPSGVPVATMAVNGAKNAAIFALEIFGTQNATVAKQLEAYREKLRENVAKKAARIASQINH